MVSPLQRWPQFKIAALLPSSRRDAGHISGSECLLVVAASFPLPRLPLVLPLILRLLLVLPRHPLVLPLKIHQWTYRLVYWVFDLGVRALYVATSLPFPWGTLSTGGEGNSAWGRRVG
eukprot:3178317-Pyramimonas_sp.AAC.1